jgi:hypothetical protein
MPGVAQSTESVRQRIDLREEALRPRQARRGAAGRVAARSLAKPLGEASA